MKRFVCAVLVLALMALNAEETEAKSTRETTYRYNQIWSTVVRFLRVDNRFTIVEQDKKAGYVLFVYPEAKRSLHGSVELVSNEKDNKQSVRTTIRIQDMPTYVEVMLIEKLLRKLRDEYGDPPPARPVVTHADKPAGEKASTKATGTSQEPPEDESDIEVNEDDLEDTQEE